MSDFFDDEQVTGQEAPEEPAEERKIKKKNGLVKIAVYLVCVGIIAGGCFAAARLIPEKKTDESDGSAAEETIPVISEELSKVRTLTVYNSKGTVTLYAEGEGDRRNWYVDGVKKELISTSLSSSFASSVTGVSASRKVTKMTLAECGLDEPLLKALIQREDDSVIGFSIGADSLVGDTSYLKVDGSDDIYLVDGSLKSDLDVDALYFAAADTVPGITETDSTKDFFNNGQLTSCDSITVTGKNYPKPLTIVRNDDTQINQYVNYKVISPDEHLADNVDSLFSIFSSGITAGGAYSYYAADLSRFGLDDPDITVRMALKSQVHTFKLSLQSDGDYAAWSSTGNYIYKVSSSSVDSFVNSKATDYYSSLVCLFSIDDLSGFSVRTADKDYTFGIKANDDADADDNYIITYNGKNIDCKSFQNLYQFIISIPCYDYETANVTSGDKITFEFATKSGNSNTVEFIKADETRYQYSMNGKPMGKVASTKLNKILKYTAKLANGEKISQLD